MPNFHVSPFRPSKAHSPSLDTEAHATSTADPSSRTGRAFSKARKRLRGDSVSPSPKKPRVSTLRLSEDNDELEEDNSFVDESPVKATTGGKNFITLFEEERIPAPNFSGNARPTNKVASTSNGAKRRLVFPSQSKDSKQIPSSSRPPDAAAEIPSGEPDRRASDATSTSNSSACLKRRSPHGSDSASPPPGSVYATPVVLLPPSPTQEGQPKSQKMTAKNLMKRRKNMNGLNDGDLEDEQQEDESVDVVELTPSSKRIISNRHSSDEDEDSSFLKVSARQDDEQSLDGSQRDTSHRLEVNLPEELRDILYISSSQNSEMKERAIAESLLKGDSSYSGQSAVWGVGEVTRPDLTGSDDEEDWEGEGTPWEVGEL